MHRPLLQIFVVLLIGAAWVAPAWASGTINGTVTLLGAVGSPPVDRARLRLLYGRTVRGRTQTDANGTYSFDPVAPGTYRIEFWKAGFLKVVQSDVIVTDAVTTVNAALPAHLRLMSVCSMTPSATRRWRVRNRLDLPIRFQWKIDSGQRGTAVAPPSSSKAFSFFEAPTVANQNVASVYVDVISVNHRRNVGRRCGRSAASVAVSVTDANGPIADAIVTITDDASADNRNGVTEADGTVEFSQLPTSEPITVSVASTSRTAAVRIPSLIDGANFVPVTLPAASIVP